ncbi:SDR family NAD(P)-dependent oxidoreductase [Botrimarina hoheduenensis]|uniref:Cyclic-di-GMP-binding biofilm dispersal mediator protein n=1 Tax=Botrimarina hoheduenensis TaxID=2528000 RepID=A0A5C5VVH7_9BACT|nr:SDR family NAD(P)-dependent oxidoreductase [Botrimarina hoheduenensis]TWT41601.1 Cyclic-di-GMP-binding biofilm dispersal mediator protein [Botrimarina hoheduenensis]
MTLSSESPAKHALITGGSAGFGLALAQAYAERGYQLTIVGRVADRLEAAAQTLQCGGAAGVATLSADLGMPGEGIRVVQAAIAASGRLDAVCHAAGRSSRGWATETPREEFEALLRINFLAAVELAAASAEALCVSRGSLILIGSLATRVAPAGLGAYPASKHPLAALAQQYRLERGPRGHHTLLVCPGPLSRADAGERYNAESAGLPERLRKPAGGARVSVIDPHVLARQVLRACERRQAELIVPAKARWLFVLSQLSPRWGDWLLNKKMGGSSPSGDTGESQPGSDQ